MGLIGKSLKVWGMAEVGGLVISLGALAALAAGIGLFKLLKKPSASTADPSGGGSATSDPLSSVMSQWTGGAAS